MERSFQTGLAAYLVAETLASENLKLGLSVITDSVRAVKEAREIWRDLSRKHLTRLIIIECVLDSRLHKKRVESRVRNIHGIPDLTWNDVEDRRKVYLEWKEERLVLDMANNIEANLRTALSYIEKIVKQGEE